MSAFSVLRSKYDSNVIRSIHVLLAFFAYQAYSMADPCGMVPPITIGDTIPITRIGDQQTYVFFKDGIETFVIRPGYSGKIDEFGMLIPFPTPPALRKIPDNIFGHIAAAIDPPEVVVDLLPRALAANTTAKSSRGLTYRSRKSEVRVLRKEAVGMYEVAVLEAGSAEALKRWMDEHGYRYPTGMDKVCGEYVQDGWCFVAVKTKVGAKNAVAPQPGQRSIQSQLPDGSVFDGNVQAMGFRFKTDELVVPMRLSAFNKGKLRNIVYLLADGPRRIRKIPEEYVVRQIPGSQLIKNVTAPLPLRIIGGKLRDFSPRRLESINVRRDPHAKNGAAKELFAADLLAVSTGKMALPQEEREKEFLRIGERLGLRGSEIDQVNAAALSELNARTVEHALKDLQQMTLTVIDGDFPRQVIADANLSFDKFVMSQAKNSRSKYDAKTKSPGIQRTQGTVILGSLQRDVQPDKAMPFLNASVGIGAILIPFGFWMSTRRNKRRSALLALPFIAAVAVPEPADAWQAFPAEIQRSIEDLKDAKSAENAIGRLATQAKKGGQQEAVIKALVEVAQTGDELTQRGWAIAALSEIGGYAVDEHLLSIHANENQSVLIRTWAAAARVAMTKTPAGLVEKAQLIKTFPALGRPIGMRLVEKLGEDENISVEKLMETAAKIPQLQKAVAPAILAHGSKALLNAMISDNDQNTRRQAAAYLGTLAQQDESVPEAVAKALAFRAEAKDVAWNGGPLFIPGIEWPKADAQAIAGSLVEWHLWCDRHDRVAEKRQIHNNLRSLGLARAAGYESPRNRDATTMKWLEIWGNTIGKERLQELLAKQNALNSEYANVLRDLE